MSGNAKKISRYIDRIRSSEHCMINDRLKPLELSARPLQMGHGRVVKSPGGTWALPTVVCICLPVAAERERQAGTRFPAPWSTGGGRRRETLAAARWTRLRRCCDAFAVSPAAMSLGASRCGCRAAGVRQVVASARSILIEVPWKYYKY